jgi:hypothetical protein
MGKKRQGDDLEFCHAEIRYSLALSFALFLASSMIG